MVKRAKEKGFNFVYLQRRRPDRRGCLRGGVHPARLPVRREEDPSLQGPDRRLEGRAVREVRSPDLRNVIEEVLRGVPCDKPRHEALRLQHQALPELASGFGEG